MNCFQNLVLYVAGGMLAITMACSESPKDVGASETSSQGADLGEVDTSIDHPSAWEGSECSEERRCDGDLVLECQNGSWVTVAQCSEGFWCDTSTFLCTEAACGLGEKRCTDERTIQACSLDRSHWQDPTPCPGDQICMDGVCLRPECYPGVLFAVDHSQSMLPQWDQVSRSISRLMHSNPSVRYGMLAFPNEVVEDNICRFGFDWPEVAIGESNQDDISDWLDSNLPDGATPLAYTLQWVLNNAATLWNGEEMGYLVILSDGADSCACKHLPNDQVNGCLNERYMHITSQLLEQNIRTYVVGYSYDDEDGGLDTIASHGGTGRDRFTYVGDEDELNQAFESIIREIKDCQ